MAFWTDVFGFSFKKTDPLKDVPDKSKSFVAVENDDGAYVIDSEYSGASKYLIDFDASIKQEQDAILRYREAAMQPEADSAIDDICNEAIVKEEGSTPVEINLEELETSSGIKKTIQKEFDEILKLLEFNEESYSIFRKWYIDGRLYYHVIIDPQKQQEGILEIRPISPFDIKKIREISREKDEKTGIELIKTVKEYYLYSDSRLGFRGQGIKISPDSICYVHSGLYDERKKIVLGHIQKALKPINQLRMMEDAMVIYRLSRAPERRVFYIDVGSLPKIKAEQYLKGIMNKYKNKLVYDAITGNVRDTTNQLSMMEDFWLPRREGNKGTQIEVLQGGQNLGNMEDVLYMQKRMLKSLNVPQTRLESEDKFNLGRASEITRDELKFAKFISRLRGRFSHLFLELLRTQLIVKKIINPEEWDDLKEHIRFEYANDSYFEELKETEIMKERLNLLREVDMLLGKYFSIEYARRHILKQSDDEMETINKQIEQERKKGLLPPAEMLFNPLENMPEVGPDQGEGGAGANPFGGGKGGFGGNKPKKPQAQQGMVYTPNIPNSTEQRVKVVQGTGL